MPLRRRLDPNFPIKRQLGIETGPIVLVNVFTLDRRRAGFPQNPERRCGIHEAAPWLHLDPASSRARRESDLPELCHLESTAAFRAAFPHPKLRAKISAYPSSAVASPRLFQKVAAPGVCVA